MTAPFTAGDTDETLDRSLDIHADLTLDVAGERVSVRGYGDVVVVDAPTLAVAWSLVGTAGAMLTHLSAADVTLDCRVRGHSVARAGPNVDTDPLSRALGLAPARISLGGLLLAVVASF